MLHPLGDLGISKRLGPPNIHPILQSLFCYTALNPKRCYRDSRKGALVVGKLDRRHAMKIPIHPYMGVSKNWGMLLKGIHRGHIGDI